MEPRNLIRQIDAETIGVHLVMALGLYPSGKVENDLHRIEWQRIDLPGGPACTVKVTAQRML
jgi:hypothetical protein